MYSGRSLKQMCGCSNTHKKELLWNGSGTLPIHSHFHWYITYCTSCNRAGVDSMQWHIQERPATTIQNKQDGCRTANNTLDMQVYTATPTTAINLHSYSPVLQFGRLLLILVLVYLFQRLMLCFSDWLYDDPVASRGSFFSLYLYPGGKKVTSMGTRSILCIKEERN